MARDRGGDRRRLACERLKSPGSYISPAWWHRTCDRLYAFQRLIGSICHECLDHIVVFGEAYLHRILEAYARQYSELRTHLSLDKDSLGYRPIKQLGQLGTALNNG